MGNRVGNLAQAYITPLFLNHSHLANEPQFTDTSPPTTFKAAESENFRKLSTITTFLSTLLTTLPLTVDLEYLRGYRH